MKFRTNTWVRLSIIIGLTIISADLYGQKKQTSRLSVEYFKQFDQLESLVATLRAKDKRYLALSDTQVTFYSINDTSRVLLDQIQTNSEGVAIFTIDDNPEIREDSMGQLTFEVEYEGSPLIKPTSRKLVVKRADLDLSFYQKDSIKYIDVQAISSDSGVPIQDVDITFYLKGTFSELNFGYEITDENGKAKINFPIDMPGDTAGVLSVIVKIEDHDDYGNVESRGKINWGIPNQILKQQHRGLGDTDAPLWMVYTLIILLSIVWSNYLYVIFMIFKIKISHRSL